MNTPLYVFNSEMIKKNYQRICSLINNAHICYALKANSEEGVLKILAEEGAEFECASVEEFDSVRKIGIQSDHIIFGLPIKSEETIKHVYENGGRYFVFEELLELYKLIKWAPDSNKVLRIDISDIVSDTIDFGMSMEQILINEGDWLQYVDGISFHISNNTNLDVFHKVCGRVCKILELVNEKRKKKYIVNIGGGLRIDVEQEFYDGMNKEIEKIMEKFDIDLYAEPGEVIVGMAGKFYTKVILTKENGRSIDVYMDSGIPQGYATRRKPSAVNIYGNERIRDKQCIYRFIDCTCMGTALFSKRTNLDIRDNDILEFEGCGAYSTVFCNEFHGYEKCTVIFK